MKKQIVNVNGKQVEIKVNQMMAGGHQAYYRKNIIRWLGRIGIKKDYINIDHSVYGYEDPWAEVRWKVNGKEHRYRCTSQESATKCLAAVEQLVHYEVIFIERGIKTFIQVMNQFLLDDKTGGKSPREVLGIPLEMNDKEYIKWKYKKLAKEMHPDTGGDKDKFIELKTAYEQLMEDKVGK